MNPANEKPRRFVPPLGALTKPRAVTTWNARRSPMIRLNRYPRQVIGVTFRLPDGKDMSGRTTHHALSIVWAKPARWWR